MSELLRRLGYLFRRRRIDAGLEEEMRSHLAMQAEEHQASGMDAGEARYAARRQFGNPALLKEASREAWGWRWLETLLQDLRYALRTLRSSPGFTATALLSLALGIGVNTSIFSFIHEVLLRPLPVPEPGRLVSLYHRSSQGWLSSSSYPDYRFYRERNEVFEGMVAFLRVPMLLRTGDADEKFSGELASGDYFSVLGLKPALGRWFGPSEAEPLLVLSHDFWQRRFGADPGVVGRNLRVGAGSFTVCGIAPPGFRGLVLDWGTPADLWVPAGMYRQAVPAFREIDVLNLWGMHSFLIAGKLRPGVTFERARAAMALLSDQAEPLRGKAMGGRRFTAELYPIQQARFWPDSRAAVKRSLALLAAGVGLILLIACLNLANLLLARNAQRQREIAVRLSIGAGRGRLIRQFLTESLVLSLAGGTAGLLVARWTASYLAGFQRPFGVPLPVDTGFDLRVLGFALLLSLATCLLFGLVPATQASRLNLTAALKTDSARLAGRLAGIRLRDALVVAQVALSAVLLAGAGLFLRTVHNARAQDVTLRPEKVLVAGVDPTIQGYDERRRSLFYSQLLDRVRALPGVESAALVQIVPLGGMRGGTDIVAGLPERGGEKARLQVDYNVVSPGYFETVGLPLVRGRAFTGQDRQGAPAVAVINEVMARRFWPAADPLGRRFALTRPDGLAVEVVGVVRDGRFRNFRDTHRPCFYLPLAQQPGPSTMTLEVRAAGEPAMLAAAIRNEVRAIDPAIPLSDVVTLQSIRERGMSQERLMASLLTGFGALALALAAIGIYGLVAFSVSRRTREIGIRMALGARSGQVAQAVLRRSAALAAIGLMIGLVGAFLSTRLIASLLFEVSPGDPAVFGAIAAALLAAALVAGFLPARRAARIDPVEALRYE